MVSVIQFGATAIAHIAFCIIGVTVGVDSIEVTPFGLAVARDGARGGAYAGIAYYDPSVETMREHEIGHLTHAQKIGVVYLIAAPIGSIAAAIRQRRTGEWGAYFDIWTEREADRLGGVQR